MRDIAHVYARFAALVFVFAAYLATQLPIA
jgi:hypothetical protein